MQIIFQTSEGQSKKVYHIDVTVLQMPRPYGSFSMILLGKSTYWKACWTLAYTAIQRAQHIFGWLLKEHLLPPHPTQCTGPWSFIILMLFSSCFWATFLCLPPSVTVPPWNLFGKSCDERHGCCYPSCWCVDAEFSQGISFKTVPGVTITCLEASMRIFIWTAYFKRNLTLVRLRVMNNSWQHPVISCIKSSSPTRLHCWVSLWLRKSMLNMIFIQNNRERLRGHVCYRLQSTLSLSDACYTHGPLMTPHRALLCPATPTICDESQTCGTLSSYEKHHQGRQQWIMGIRADRKRNHIIRGCCCDSPPLEA